MVALPFGSFSDPQTGRVLIRQVNVQSSSYRVAREYMIRLDRRDLDDPDKLRPIAAASGLTPQAFRDRFGYLADAASSRLSASPGTGKPASEPPGQSNGKLARASKGSGPAGG